MKSFNEIYQSVLENEENLNEIILFPEPTYNQERKRINALIWPMYEKCGSMEKEKSKNALH